MRPAVEWRAWASSCAAEPVLCATPVHVQPFYGHPKHQIEWLGVAICRISTAGSGDRPRQHHTPYPSWSRLTNLEQHEVSHDKTCWRFGFETRPSIAIAARLTEHTRTPLSPSLHTAGRWRPITHCCQLSQMNEQPLWAATSAWQPQIQGTEYNGRLKYHVWPYVQMFSVTIPSTMLMADLFVHIHRGVTEVS